LQPPFEVAAPEYLLHELPYHYRSGDVIFTHAGLNPRHRGAEMDDVGAMLWGHPDFLTDQPLCGLRVVHGHFDTSAPISTRGRICVDTGAYYSGVLTAVRLDAGEAFLSVSSLELD